MLDISRTRAFFNRIIATLSLVRISYFPRDDPQDLRIFYHLKNPAIFTRTLLCNVTLQLTYKYKRIRIVGKCNKTFLF